MGHLSKWRCDAESCWLRPRGRTNLTIGYGSLGVDVKTVALWRARFAEAGPEGLWKIAPGRGRKPDVSSEQDQGDRGGDAAHQAQGYDAVELPRRWRRPKG